jgi:hypothetical protein
VTVLVHVIFDLFKLLDLQTIHLTGIGKRRWGGRWDRMEEMGWETGWEMGWRGKEEINNNMEKCVYNL